jgi:hypothetical protein
LPLIAEKRVLLPDCIKPSNATFKEVSPTFYIFCTGAIIDELRAENKLFTIKEQKRKGGSDTLSSKSFVLGRNRVCKAALKKISQKGAKLK